MKELFIFITSGTYEFLIKYKEKYPNENLLLIQNEDTSLLIQETEGESLFKEPRRYEVIDAAGTWDNGGFVVFNNIPVTDEGRPIFEYRFKNRARLIEKEPGFASIRVLRPKQSDTYIIITIWENKKDFENWQKSASFGKAHGNNGKEKETGKGKTKVFPRPSYVTKYVIPEEENRKD